MASSPCAKRRKISATEYETSKAQENHVFPLMKLPLELRQQIYSYFLLTAKARVRPKDLKACIGSTFKMICRLPELLSTSRTVRYEAFRPMVQYSVFELCGLHIEDIRQCQDLIDSKKLGFNFVRNVTMAAITIPEIWRCGIASAERALVECSNIVFLRISDHNKAILPDRWFEASQDLMTTIVDLKALSLVQLPALPKGDTYRYYIDALDMGKQIMGRIEERQRPGVSVKQGRLT